MKALKMISTTLYVTTKARNSGCEVRAQRVAELKPRITYDEAKEVVQFVDEMFREAAPV